MGSNMVRSLRLGAGAGDKYFGQTRQDPGQGVTTKFEIVFLPPPLGLGVYSLPLIAQRAY
jgi:hypothetical protein